MVFAEFAIAVQQSVCVIQSGNEFDRELVSGFFKIRLDVKPMGDGVQSVKNDLNLVFFEQ